MRTFCSRASLLAVAVALCAVFTGTASALTVTRLHHPPARYTSVTPLPGHHAKHPVTAPHQFTSDVKLNVYWSGVLFTFNRGETAAIGASAAFAPTEVAAVGFGFLDGKLWGNIYTVQAYAAYEAAVGRCLWVWVPYWGNTNQGGWSGYGC